MMITHDFHLHANLSVCADHEVTAADYVANARSLGLKKLGFGDLSGMRLSKAPTNFISRRTMIQHRQKGVSE